MLVVAATVARALELLRKREGIVVVDGARLRAEPVFGQVQLTLRRGSRVVLVCERRVAGGRYWGMILAGGDVGWIRGDLYEIAGRGAEADGPRSC